MMVEHWHPQHDGELNEDNLRRKFIARGYHVEIYAYPPGTFFPEHTHEVDKIDAVLRGQFRMTLHGTSVVLHAGDCLMIPRGVLHSAEVVGEETVISLDAVKHS